MKIFFLNFTLFIIKEYQVAASCKIVKIVRKSYTHIFEIWDKIIVCRIF